MYMYQLRWFLNAEFFGNPNDSLYAILADGCNRKPRALVGLLYGGATLARRLRHPRRLAYIAKTPVGSFGNVRQPI